MLIESATNDPNAAEKTRINSPRYYLKDRKSQRQRTKNQMPTPMSFACSYKIENWIKNKSAKVVGMKSDMNRCKYTMNIPVWEGIIFSTYCWTRWTVIELLFLYVWL